MSNEMGKSLGRKQDENTMASLDERVGFPHGFNFQHEGKQYNVLTKQISSKGKQTYEIAIIESGKAMERILVSEIPGLTKEQLKGITDIIKLLTVAQAPL